MCKMGFEYLLIIEQLYNNNIQLNILCTFLVVYVYISIIGVLYIINENKILM